MSDIVKMTNKEANRVIDILLERFQKDSSLFSKKQEYSYDIIAKIPETEKEVKISQMGFAVYVTIAHIKPPFNFSTFKVEKPENLFAFKEKKSYALFASKVAKLAKLIKDKNISPKDSVLYNTFPEYIDGFINEDDK